MAVLELVYEVLVSKNWERVTSLTQRKTFKCIQLFFYHGFSEGKLGKCPIGRLKKHLNNILQRLILDLKVTFLGEQEECEGENRSLFIIDLAGAYFL